MYSFQGKKKFQINKSIKKHCARYKHERRCNASSKSTRNDDSNDKFNKVGEKQDWFVINIDDGMSKTDIEYGDFLNYKTLHMQDANSCVTDQTNYATSSDDGIRKCLCASADETTVYKQRLRILADCFSFLCGICLWGIFDDLVIIMSADNIFVKFCLYCIVTIISAAVTLTLNAYRSKCSRYEKKIECQSVERRGHTMLRR